MRLPSESGLRQALDDQLHARPFEAVGSPAAVLSVALLRRDGAQDAACHAHLECLVAGVADWRARPVHVRLEYRGLRIKWERHTEFYGFTFFFEPPETTLERAFDTHWLEALPPGWLEGLPGEVIAATQLALLPWPDEPPHVRDVAALFASEQLAGNRVAGGAATVVTDLRAAGGATRYLVLDHGLNRRRAGRTLQRLVEVDTYRMMALLALPIATRRMADLGAEEAQLAALMERFRAPEGADDVLLHELGDLAARVEHAQADGGARFSATHAYATLVERRLSELREQVVPGLQPLSEFLARRFRPAVDSCAATQSRQMQLSERVARAAQLLQARFDLERERQNQALLASLDRRQALQLRLQETVEGLSVIAMTYYGVALCIDVLRPFAASAEIDEHWIGLAAVPLVGAAVVANMRRVRRHLARD